MAKILLVGFVAVAIMGLLLQGAHSADEEVKCFKCSPSDDCNDMTDKVKSEVCSSKICYIYGDEDKETWTRGCTDNKDFCKSDVAKNSNCTICETNECNAGSSVVSSMAFTAVVALLLKYVR